MARPTPSFIVSEADVDAAGLADGPPPPVERWLAGRGLLLAGLDLEEAADEAVLEGLLLVAAGPHVSVADGAPSLAEELLLERAGVTRLEVPLERFVAELSRRIAARNDGRPGEVDPGAPH